MGKEDFCETELAANACIVIFKMEKGKLIASSERKRERDLPAHLQNRRIELNFARRCTCHHRSIYCNGKIVSSIKESWSDVMSKGFWAQQLPPRLLCYHFQFLATLAEAHHHGEHGHQSGSSVALLLRASASQASHYYKALIVHQCVLSHTMLSISPESENSQCAFANCI